MDPILSGKALDDEITAVKRHLQALQSQKLKLQSDHVSPEADRPKRVAIPQIPLAEPPKPVVAGGSSTDNGAISITLKSPKPPLTFSLSCPPTSTIAELKQLLVAQHPDAPTPDAQRWVFKGKALSDTKMLREYDAIKPGETVHLIVKAAAAPASSGTSPIEVLTSGATLAPSPVVSPVPGSPSLEPIAAGRKAHKLSMSIPKITMDSVPGLSEPDGSDPSAPAHPARARSPSNPHVRSGSVSSQHSPHLGVTESFRVIATDPQFWVSVREFLGDKFGPTGPGESNMRQMWEHWFGASKEWMTASDIMKIREAAGISGMGGQ